MMFCKNCGNKAKEDDTFCTYCGHNLGHVIPDTVVDKGLGLAERPSSKYRPDRRFLVKIVLGLLGIIVVYIIFAEKPFSFLADNRTIPQNIITSSVVNILCESRVSNDVSRGSGTIITEDGVVITNSHVIPQDDKYLYVPEKGCLVILPDRKNGQPKEIYWGKPTVMPELSDQYDLAILKIYEVYTDEIGKSYGRYPKTFQSIFAESNKYDDICLLSRNVKLGDSVRIYGYPQTSGGYNLTVTDGIASSFPDKGLILTSAKIDAGNSGGLAVDRKGCMVGVPSAISEGKYQNLGVIISMDLVLEFSEKISNTLDK